MKQDASRASENIEVVKRLYDGCAAGDLASVNACLHPDVVALEAASLPYAGCYKGIEGFNKLLEALGAYWQDLTCTEFEYTAQNDTVVVQFRLLASSRKTGARVDQKLCEVWKLKDGKIIFLQAFYFDTYATAKILGHA